MMSDQKQRTEWALSLFGGFVETWTPTGAGPLIVPARARVEQAIRDIAPMPDDTGRIGWAVFRREHDRDYDRERPSGFVHTMISAVFETTTQAHNAYTSRVDRGDGHRYLVCELRAL